MKIRFRPEEVLFSITGECNIACGHCVAEKSSKTLSLKDAKRFLRGCRKMGVERIGFTGGEPFLKPGLLCGLTRAAVRAGFVFDRIMTSGVWYGSKEGLKTVLSGLFAAGYDGEICVSVDAFHKQGIGKLAYFINSTARIFNRTDMVSIAYVSGAKMAETKKKIRRLSALLNPGLFIRLLNIELSPIGKAAVFKNGWGKRHFKEDFCRGPGNVFYVMPDGKVKPCCGYASDRPELTIGNINRNSPAEIYRNIKRNRLVSTIFRSGLVQIRKRLEKSGFKFPGKAYNSCYFCNYILTEIPRETLNKCIC